MNAPVLPNAPYTSRTPYHAEHPNVLAIYCSDGRFTRAVEDLASELGHERIDVLSVPGGPGAMDPWTVSVIHADYLLRQADFLIAGHHIRTVILVSHENCGFYKDRYKDRPGEVDDTARRNRQAQDLNSAAEVLRNRHSGLRVAAYHARPGVDGGVQFVPAVTP